MEAAQKFLDYSCAKLNQYCDRIGVCLEQLSEEDIWIRGTDHENAIGNLILHLSGNLHQWIGFGVAGKPDVRMRDQEFEARDGAGAAELKARLDAAVRETIEIVSSLSASQFNGTVRVQGYEVSVLEAVYHVVEHFSYHTGQIIFATKMLNGQDLGFYAHLNQAEHSEQAP